MYYHCNGCISSFVKKARWVPLCSTCCFDHFDLKRKQKVFEVGRDIVGWFVRNVAMQSLEYNWQNWQYIKKTTNINSRFHRDGKPTDFTSPTWGRRRGRMRSQSRPNLNCSPRRRRPENVCILSSLFYWRDSKMAFYPTNTNLFFIPDLH